MDLIGLVCYGVYYVRSTEFILVPTNGGNVLIICDDDGARILREIDSRRAGSMRQEYDFFPEGDGPEQLASRFRWLHGEGVLSDEELQQRLTQIQAQDSDLQVPLIAPPGRLLN